MPALPQDIFRRSQVDQETVYGTQELGSFSLLISKMLLRSMTEVSGLGRQSIYGKLAFLYRQCLRFSRDHECRLLEAMLLPKLYLATAYWRRTAQPTHALWPFSGVARLIGHASKIRCHID